MTRKDIIDWINDERSKGYNYAEIKKCLAQEGYSKKNIQKAMNDFFMERQISFSLIDYMKKLSWLNILFIAAFLFLSYSFNKLIEGMGLLISLGIIASVIHTLHSMKRPGLARHLTILSFTAALGAGFYLNIIYFIIPCILTCLHAISYYLKDEKKNSLETVFITLFTSMIFSLTITFLLYLGFAYLLFPLIGTVQVIIAFLVLSPLAIIFVVSYILTSRYLLEKSTGKFNFDAYFRFRHFPFTILNILSTKKGNYKSSVIKSAGIIYLAFLAAGIAVHLLANITFVEQLYQNDDYTLYNRKFYTMHDAASRYNKILELQHAENIDIIPVKRTVENNYNFNYDILKDVKYIYGNCNNLLQCEKTPYLSYEKIENLLNGHNIILIADIDGEKSLFIPPYESQEDYLSHSYFEFEPEELQATPFVKQIDSRKKQLMRDLLGRIKEDKPGTWQAKLSFYYNERAFDLIIEQILFLEKWSAEFGNIGIAIRAAKEEYKIIKANEINRTPFYDGTTTLQEHIENLSKKISVSNYDASISRFIKPTMVELLTIFEILQKNDSIFDKANEKITGHLLVYLKAKELNDKFSELIKQFTIKDLADTYDSEGVEENNMSKSIRLRALDISMAEYLILNCKDKSCEAELVNLTKSTTLCWYVKHLNRNECPIS